MSTAGVIASNSPNLRGAVLAHVLHHVVTVPGPVTYNAIFSSTLEAMGKPEEECSLEIMTTVSLLANAGLVVTNTFEGGCLTISAETMLTAAPHITSWIWRDDDGQEG